MRRMQCHRLRFLPHRNLRRGRRNPPPQRARPKRPPHAREPRHSGRALAQTPRPRVSSGPAPEPARSIRDEVNALPDLDIKMLRQKWRGIMGKTAPPHIGKPLMVRILAYRIQADAYGDLPREVAAFLDKLGAGTPGQDNR